MPIIDLHCDLLGYLAHKPGRSPYATEPRCGYYQLATGGVKLQIMALASTTGTKSVAFGETQRKRFMQLPDECPMRCFSEELTDQLQIMGAYENASAFCSEEEPLENGLKRLEKTLTKLPLLYVSLTWNGENRFGGGVGSKVGLKADGKTLIEFLSGKGIALDFSHTSDALAEDLFNFLESRNLNPPVMASHSNFRAVACEQRNLPDLFAKEILRRGGILGLVFFKPFLGPHFSSIIQQIEHGLTLGGENQLALGADFFYDKDFTTELKQHCLNYGFFDEMKDASCYPALLTYLEKHFSKALVENLSYKNAFSFIQRRKNLS